MEKNSKDKILQNLAGLLPEDIRKDAIAAVEAFFESTKKEMDAEYSARLEDAYKTVAEEKAETQKVAEQGYAEAYQIICELRDRLEVQREEFEHALNQGYEEAYQQILQERSKNESLETDMRDQYEKRFEELNTFYAEKLDQFLREETPRIREEIRRDVIADPMVAEHRVVLDKIKEITMDHLCEEEYYFATTSKLEEAKKQVEDIKAQIRLLESKNMRLATENTRLNENLRQQAEVLSEATRQEKNERQKKARTAEGKGRRVVEDKQVQVIAEHNETPNETVTNDDDDAVNLIEHNDVNSWAKLAGVPVK